MKKLVLCFTTLLLSLSALGAKKDDYWIKAESEETKKTEKNKAAYPYDSLEKQRPKVNYLERGFWTLDPKLVLATGYHADKFSLQNDKKNRFFFRPGLQFLNHPWYRFSLHTLLLQNNSLIVSGAWEYTPSRKSFRQYYGIGASLRMVAEKEFSNLVEFNNYSLTVHTGVEYLLQNHHGLMAELKGFISTKSYTIQLSVGYIIPI